VSLRRDRRLQRVRLLLFLLVIALAFNCRIRAQQTVAALPETPQPQSAEPVEADSSRPVSLRTIPINVLHDQAAIWTSPIGLKPHDLVRLAPLSLATGAALATDHHAISQVVSHDADFNNANTNASNVLIGGFIATPAVLYVYGHFEQTEHAREAGLLSAEALLDGLVVEQGIKLITWRERPNVDGQHGRFFQSSAGVDSSFPSSHSVVAWATASAIASEYPSRWTQFFVYSAATGVSLTRVMGQQHFPSDVLVGSAAGWLIGRYVVQRHHRARQTR